LDGYATSSFGRTNPRTEKGFLGVDVADPDHHCLIHDQRLDRHFAAAASGPQVCGIESGGIKRLWSKSIKIRMPEIWTDPIQ